MADANPIPSDYPRVTPHLAIAGAAAAIEFYTRVLGATERMRMPAADGTVAHAEIAIGDSVIMIGEEAPDRGDPSPRALGGTPVLLYTYVADVDDVFNRAIEAGAKPVSPPTNLFYGDRGAIFEDPFGHKWNIATRVENLSPADMERRAMAAMARS
jgi:PhnB protein